MEAHNEIVAQERCNNLRNLLDLKSEQNAILLQQESECHQVENVIIMVSFALFCTKNLLDGFLRRTPSLALRILLRWVFRCAAYRYIKTERFTDVDLLPNERCYYVAFFRTFN